MIYAKCIKETCDLKVGRIYKCKMLRDRVEVYGIRKFEEEGDERWVETMPRCLFRDYLKKW